MSAWYFYEASFSWESHHSNKWFPCWWCMGLNARKQTLDMCRNFHGTRYKFTSLCPKDAINCIVLWEVVKVQLCWESHVMSLHDLDTWWNALHSQTHEWINIMLEMCTVVNSTPQLVAILHLILQLAILYHYWLSRGEGERAAV